MDRGGDLFINNLFVYLFPDGPSLKSEHTTVYVVFILRSRKWVFPRLSVHTLFVPGPSETESDSTRYGGSDRSGSRTGCRPRVVSEVLKQKSVT